MIAYGKDFISPLIHEGTSKMLKCNEDQWGSGLQRFVFPTLQNSFAQHKKGIIYIGTGRKDLYFY